MRRLLDELRVKRPGGKHATYSSKLADKLGALSGQNSIVAMIKNVCDNVVRLFAGKGIMLASKTSSLAADQATGWQNGLQFATATKKDHRRQKIMLTYAVELCRINSWKVGEEETEFGPGFTAQKGLDHCLDPVFWRPRHRSCGFRPAASGTEGCTIRILLGIFFIFAFLRGCFKHLMPTRNVKYFFCILRHIRVLWTKIFNASCTRRRYGFQRNEMKIHTVLGKLYGTTVGTSFRQCLIVN